MVFQESTIEGRDVMTTGITELEEEFHEKILDKPGSSYRAIVENGTALDLNEAGAVVKMNSDCCR